MSHPETVWKFGVRSRCRAEMWVEPSFSGLRPIEIASPCPSFIRVLRFPALKDRSQLNHSSETKTSALALVNFQTVSQRLFGNS